MVPQVRNLNNVHIPLPASEYTCIIANYCRHQCISETFLLKMFLTNQFSSLIKFATVYWQAIFLVEFFKSHWFTAASMNVKILPTPIDGQSTPTCMMLFKCLSCIKVTQNTNRMIVWMFILFQNFIWLVISLLILKKHGVFLTEGCQILVCLSVQKQQ